MNEIKERLATYFPDLLGTDLADAIQKQGRLENAESGNVLIEIGGFTRFMPLVTKGAIKVGREDENGNEVFLYFLYPGQSCAMTVQCCMANMPSEIRAVAEDDTEFIAIPTELLSDFMKYPQWSNFILTTYNQRFSELLRTIDGLVFHNLDERILDYLKSKAKVSGSSVVKATHQEIAFDLNSSREVISRLLKQLEKRGDIQLGRNKISLT